jgi:hypothetical protein
VASNRFDLGERHWLLTGHWTAHGVKLS